MRLCAKHWDKLKESLPEGNWLLANVKVMERLPAKVDPALFMHDIRRLQEEIGEEGCPVCFTGEELLDEVIQEIKGGLFELNTSTWKW